MRRENRASLLFAAPQFLLYFTFTLLPFLLSLPLAFMDYVNFSDRTPEFAGLGNFVAIFTNPALTALIWPTVLRTFVFMLANYGTVLLFGLGLALMMYELSTRIQKMFFVIVYLPYIISGLGVGMFIELLLARDTGSLNLLLQLVHVIRSPINLKTSGATLLALVVFVGWRYAGYNMAIFLSGLLTISVETIEAARIDGARYHQRLWRIYLPQMAPSIAIATISCLVGSFGIFEEPVGFGALYGNQQARLFAVTLFRMGAGGSMDMTGKLSEGVASTIVVAIPLLVLAFLIFRWQRRRQQALG
jgi:ABC-type sugar transport system permease subunit